MVMYPQFTPRPLTDYTGAALSNLTQSMRSGEDQAQAKADADEQQRNVAIYQQFQKLQPDQQKELYGQLPDTARGWVLNPNAIPDHVKSALQQAQDDEALAKARFGAKTATDSISTFDTLPRSARQQGTYQSAYGAAMPVDSVKLGNAQDVTGNKSSWSPEVQQRQAIEDKRALDAQQAATIPSENALRTAQAGNQNAEARYTGGAKTAEGYANAAEKTALTGKAREETRGLKTTNDMMSGIGGLVPQGSNGTTGGGPDVSKEPNAIVRMIVKRDYDPMLLRRFKPEEQNALFARASTYDPNINTSDYPTQVATKRSFNAGKAADAVRSINQFVAHVNELADAETALDNTSVFPGIVNRTENAIGGAVSSKSQFKQDKYNQIAQAVANEYENMIRGSSVSGVKERQQVLDELNMNRSPDSIRGAIDGDLRVMQGRLGELQDQYKKGTGLQENFDVLNPRSKSILRRFGVTPDSMTTSTTPVPTPAPSPSPPNQSLSPADAQFINTATHTVNPATGQPYTQDEALAGLRKRKGQ